MGSTGDACFFPALITNCHLKVQVDKVVKQKKLRVGKSTRLFLCVSSFGKLGGLGMDVFILLCS